MFEIISCPSVFPVDGGSFHKCRYSVAKESELARWQSVTPHGVVLTLAVPLLFSSAPDVSQSLWLGLELTEGVDNGRFCSLLCACFSSTARALSMQDAWSVSPLHFWL